MSFWEITAYLIALFIAIIIFRIFKKPINAILLLCLNSVLGAIGLHIFNSLFDSADFTIGINIVTSAICGLLGLPGLILIIILKFIFGV